MLCVVILVSATGCAIFCDECYGDFCDLYAPIYTKDGNVLTEETSMAIDANNAIYLEECIGIGVLSKAKERELKNEY